MRSTIGLCGGKHFFSKLEESRVIKAIRSRPCPVCNASRGKPCREEPYFKKQLLLPNDSVHCGRLPIGFDVMKAANPQRLKEKFETTVSLNAFGVPLIRNFCLVRKKWEKDMRVKITIEALD